MNNPDPESRNLRSKLRSLTSDFTKAIGHKEQRKIYARKTKPYGGV